MEADRWTAMEAPRRKVEEKDGYIRSLVPRKAGTLWTCTRERVASAWISGKSGWLERVLQVLSQQLVAVSVILMGNICKQQQSAS